MKYAKALHGLTTQLDSGAQLHIMMQSTPLTQHFNIWNPKFYLLRVHIPLPRAEAVSYTKGELEFGLGGLVPFPKGSTINHHCLHVAEGKSLKRGIWMFHYMSSQWPLEPCGPCQDECRW
jgi:hypothetical protein